MTTPALDLPDVPTDPAGIGVVAPYDFALDGELWRWTPTGVELYLTRTPFAALPVGVAQALTVGGAAEATTAAREVLVPEPGVVAYACTSGSFIRGLDGERELRTALRNVGFPAAVTTSGALVDAVRAVGARRLAVATPYDAETTGALTEYLAAAGIEVAGTRHLGLTGSIWRVPYDVTADLVRDAFAAASDGAGAPDAVFVSCTNLRTYDLVGPLEEELGVPVLTANLVTMWGALAALDRLPVGGGRLCATRPGAAAG